MGLDATVMCNCFQEGKTSPPPFSRDWFEVDDEGYLNLRSEHDSDQNWNKFHLWRQKCCEHENMNLARERISNWAGYRQFQAAIEEVGKQNFPVLVSQLPNANGGVTPSTASAKAVLELKLFTTIGEIGSKTVLVNTASGESLHEYIAAYEGTFLFSGSHGFNAGLNELEFFAVDRTSGEVVFRATRLRQFNKNGKSISWDSDKLVWENLDTGEIFESGFPISGKQIPWENGSWEKPDGQCRFEYPAQFHVEQRLRLASDFDDIVKALTSAFTASVQTGNPVRWS